MRQIKRFDGNNVPGLKNGEWATDSYSAFLGIGNGEYKVFQGVLDLHKEQEFAGFYMNGGRLKVPAGTPFSRLKELFDNLPKVTKVDGNTYSSTLWIDLEAGVYQNDLNTWLTMSNFAYKIFLTGSNGYSRSFEKDTIIESSHAIEVSRMFLGCTGIKFLSGGLGGEGALYGYNADISVSRCAFEPQSNVGTGYFNSFSRAIYEDCTFKMSEADTPIITANRGGSLTVIKNCISDVDNNPARICGRADSSITMVGNEADLHVTLPSIVTAGTANLEILG